jgi:hypothetical protein
LPAQERLTRRAIAIWPFLKSEPRNQVRTRLPAGGSRIRTLGPGTRARDEPLRPSFRLSTTPLMARERANDASNRQRSSAADHSVALFPTDWIAASSSRQRGRRLGSLAIRISRKADKPEDGRWYRRYVGTIRRDCPLRPDRSRQRAAPASWCCAPRIRPRDPPPGRGAAGAGGTQDRLTAAYADQAA